MEQDCGNQIVHPGYGIGVFSGHKHDDSLVEMTQMGSQLVTKIEHTNLGEEKESNVR